MLKKINLTTLHTETDDNLKKYVNNKIGKLDKYISRNLRDNIIIDVRLKEIKNDKNNKCNCEVTMTLPKEKIIVSESTVNMFAAIDIVEEKLKHQLMKYKQIHNSNRFYRHVSSRFTKRHLDSNISL